MKAYYFTATWCGPCKTFGPVMSNVAETLRPYIEVEKVDIEDNPYLVEEFGVASVPTVLLAEGSKELARFIGAKDEGFVIGFIAPYIEMGGAGASG